MKKHESFLERVYFSSDTYGYPELISLLSVLCTVPVRLWKCFSLCSVLSGSGRGRVYKYVKANMIRQLTKCCNIRSNAAMQRCFSNTTVDRTTWTTNDTNIHVVISSALFSPIHHQQQQQQVSTTSRLLFSTVVTTSNVEEEPLLGVGKYKTSTGLVSFYVVESKDSIWGRKSFSIHINLLSLLYSRSFQ